MKIIFAAAAVICSIFFLLLPSSTHTQFLLLLHWCSQAISVIPAPAFIYKWKCFWIVALKWNLPVLHWRSINQKDFSHNSSNRVTQWERACSCSVWCVGASAMGRAGRAGQREQHGSVLSVCTCHRSQASLVPSVSPLHCRSAPPGMISNTARPGRHLWLSPVGAIMKMWECV